MKQWQMFLALLSTIALFLFFWIANPEAVKILVIILYIAGLVSFALYALWHLAGALTK